MEANKEKDINELCYIYHLRVRLYIQRDTLRHKYNYMLDIYRAIDNGQKVPKKYREMTKMDVRVLILEAQSKLCDVKAKIMRHTNKYDKKVKKLIESTQFSPVYRYGKLKYLCGYVPPGTAYGSAPIIDLDQIKVRHDRFLMDKEMEKMLSE